MNMNNMITTLSIRKPDDFHVHLRSRPILDAVLPYTARTFARALIMPNVPWVAYVGDMMAYREQIEQVITEQGITGFTPLMTIALHDASTVRDVRDAHKLGAVACKIYPRGATTGSQFGVTDYMAPNLRSIYGYMSDSGMVLCIHAESPNFPRLEREHRYIYCVQDIASSFKKLKMVVEHISTEHAIYFVNRSSSNVAATITAHHLVDTIDDALESPHNLCNPVPKHAADREALWKEIRWNEGKFFFGSDSAPHLTTSKHCPRPACGVFSAPGLLPRLATEFERQGVLHKLESFVSEYGAKFYGLPLNEGMITLTKGKCCPPDIVTCDSGLIKVWRGGECLNWMDQNTTEESKGGQETGEQIADSTPLA